MAVRALRGATQVDADERDAVIAATAELVQVVLERNGLTPDALISILFTTTPDLVSEFPAYAARAVGISDVPLLCASEIAVPDALPRVIRLMAFVEADFTRAQARHAYLHGAAALRTDLPRD
jgi:chorismate mutase